MDLSVLIFILLFGAVQCMLILAVLLIRKKIQAFHIYLAAYITVLMFQLACKVISKAWLWESWRQGYLLSYYLPFLYGPLILLFARSYLRDNYTWKWPHVLHFIPFAIYLSFFAFVKPHTYLPGIIRIVLNDIAVLVLQIISLTAYHIAAFLKLSKERNREQLNHLTLARSFFVKKFCIASLVITITIVSALAFLYIHFPDYQNLRWLFILLTIFIYWLSYEGLKRPELFKVIYGNAEMKHAGYMIPALVVHRPAQKYANSGLKQEEANRILHLLEKNMHENKLYLDPVLGIDTLAAKLSCQRHHLSQALNDVLHQSFNEYINQKRVHEAKMVLSDPSFNHHKIASIAYDAGFNSLSAFNEIFKKTEGLTPSQFRKLSQEQNQSRIQRV